MAGHPLWKRCQRSQPVARHHQTCLYHTAAEALPHRDQGQRAAEVGVVMGHHVNSQPPERETGRFRSFRFLTPISFLLQSLFHILHFFCRILTLMSSRKPQPQPHQLSHPRKQVHRRLALLPVSDDDESTSGDAILECLLESIQRTVGRCGRSGYGSLPSMIVMDPSQVIV